MPFVLCADFSIFPDNHVLGPAFTLAAMDFTDHPAGTQPSFVNETAGVLALQFSDPGLEVELPPLAMPSRLWMRVGAFAGPFDIDALDVSGNAIAKRHVLLLNVFHTVSFRQPDIARLVFSGGKNEGLIASICAYV